VNGVTYQKTTNSNGITTLNVNLNSNTYKVVINFEEDSSYKATSVYKLIYTAKTQTDTSYTTGDYSLSYYASVSDSYCAYSSSYIQTLSAKLTASCFDSLESAIALNQHVFRVNYLYYVNFGDTALNTLLDNVGNCVDQSSSLVALSRAQNMPVRYVLGSYVNSNAVGHAWVQTCIDNIWVVADSTNTNIIGNAQYIVNYNSVIRTPLASWYI
jgi:transglutaminase-like putative cysteine protease